MTKPTSVVGVAPPTSRETGVHLAGREFIVSSERRRDLTAIVVELFSGIHEVGLDVDKMLRSMDISVEEDTEADELMKRRR